MDIPGRTDFPVVRVVEADSITSRRWLRRRLLVAAPLALMVGVQAWYLSYTSHSATAFPQYILPGVSVGLVILLMGARVKDHLLRVRAADGVLWTGVGRFQVTQVRQSEELAWTLGSVHKRWNGTKGWVSGVLSITGDGIDFSPGRIATDAGVKQFHLPWNLMKEIRLVPEPLSVATGLEFYLSSGSEVNGEVRGGRRFVEQLKMIASRKS